ncbi:MAG: hypothetical protein QG671_1510 [Actinomycetota bacterium]|nr:hypothetical protein [Actinomycetota bacterium]
MPAVLASDHPAEQAILGTDLLPVPTSPTAVDPPAARAPFHGRLRTVCVDPLLDAWPPQTEPRDCPLSYVQLADHEVIADEPAVTVISAWKPPDQVFLTL